MRLERVSIAAVSVLFAASCGGAASTTSADPPVALDADDPAAEVPDTDADADPVAGGDVADDDPGESMTGEEPAPPVDDYSTVAVLDVNDGSATTLRGAVTGDRPVLVWFWAPH